MMPTEDIAEIRGILMGYKDDLNEIKEDIKEIKNNDKNKLERITRLETESQTMEKWREGHIKANKKHKEKFEEFKKQYFQDKDTESKWRVAMVIAIVLALFDLVTRFLIT